MTNKFNPDNKHKLLSQKRYELLPPKETLEKLMLEKGDIAVDIGCGAGFFSLPAAQLVGVKGKVYAVDISEEMLDTVKERSKKEQIDNIELIHGEKFIKLNNITVNFMLLSNVLHEIKDKNKFLQSYVDKLTPSGRIAVIEWKKKKTEAGPSLKHRISKTEIKDLLTQLNLTIIKEMNLTANHLGITARK